MAVAKRKITITEQNKVQLRIWFSKKKWPLRLGLFLILECGLDPKTVAGKLSHLDIMDWNEQSRHGTVKAKSSIVVDGLTINMTEKMQEEAEACYQGHVYRLGINLASFVLARVNQGVPVPTADLARAARNGFAKVLEQRMTTQQCMEAIRASAP